MYAQNSADFLFFTNNPANRLWLIIGISLGKLLPDDTRKGTENSIAGAVVEGLPDTFQQSEISCQQTWLQVQRLKLTWEVNQSSKKEPAEPLEKYSSKNNLWLKTLPVKIIHSVQNEELILKKNKVPGIII
ncbi:MAG: hypothetical protein V4450_18055 [Bacteroidota bacterium]